MKTQSMYDVLFSLSTLPGKFSDTAYREILKTAVDQYLIVSRYKRHSLLLNQGQVDEYIWFIEKGIARCYFYDMKSGREITTILWKEKSIVCDPVSFFHQKASEVIIEVLPDSVLYFISYRNLRNIYKSFPETEVFSRCISLQYACYHAQRVRMLSACSAWERYLQLLESHPGIELRISKEMIASYLNIRPQSLSRLLQKHGHP